MIGIEHRNVVGKVEVCGCDRAWALFAQREQNIGTAFKTKDHALEVQKQINDIFLHALHCGVLVHDTCNLHLGRGIAFHGGEQDPAKGVAKGMAEAALKGLHNDFCGVLRERFNFNNARL